ncbi:MAG: hypothetical protein Fur0022_18740 [Anaerolineales bacterium]
MIAQIHRQLTSEALGKHLPAPILARVIQANLQQDAFLYLLGAHPHFHFDDNAFAQTYAYLNALRQTLEQTLAQAQPQRAWEAFGKITHTLQDFYAHSNYVQLWLAQYPPGAWPAPDEIDPLIPELLSHPQLITGRVILPLEILGMIPRLGKLLKPLFPPDTHVRMNLDHPKTGPLFPYAFAAARKRTMAEFETLTRAHPLLLSKLSYP